MTFRAETRTEKGPLMAERKDKDVEGGVRDVASAPSQEPGMVAPDPAPPTEPDDN